MAVSLAFRPAKPWGWIVWALQAYLRVDLFWHNRLRLAQRDLAVLRSLPAGAGLILASNHADEADFKVCMELSRRCGRRFIFMMNREAFDEGFGVAGWWLQRLGAFSVERGGQHNEEAKRFAIEVVKRGREALVIFPEGEIYYLNDLVQPFKSGAVDIGMQAVIEGRKIRPDWTAYLVPMAIKYRYRYPIGLALEQRIRSMERRLFRRIQGDSLQRRLVHIAADLLHRQELRHHLKPDSDRHAELSARVQEVRRAVLTQLEGHYEGAADNSQTQTTDRAWRLSSYVRELLRHAGRTSAAVRAGFLDDLAALGRVSQMGSWQPQYVDVDPSRERLAEMVLKLEREVYGVKRPRRLANRECFLRIGDPIELGGFERSYFEEPDAVRHHVAEHLRDVIQNLIDAIPSPPAGGDHFA